ncbi:hypothetical protein [Saccharothrix deserti]|uniref:hypothetical protein n=1 Tax=Saccharothrix deserti TaxID=2593674 RepID=UPI00131C3AAD|nr:hypothetical protein [Saccharothrix deserti]
MRTGPVSNGRCSAEQQTAADETDDFQQAFGSRDRRSPARAVQRGTHRLLLFGGDDAGVHQFAQCARLLVARLHRFHSHGG